MNKKVSAVLIAVALTAAGAVSAAELNAYSIMPEKYASRIFAEFTKDTGLKLSRINPEGSFATPETPPMGVLPPRSGIIPGAKDSRCSACPWS